MIRCVERQVPRYRPRARAPCVLWLAGPGHTAQRWWLMWDGWTATTPRLGPRETSVDAAKTSPYSSPLPPVTSKANRLQPLFQPQWVQYNLATTLFCLPTTHLRIRRTPPHPFGRFARRRWAMQGLRGRVYCAHTQEVQNKHRRFADVPVPNNPGASNNWGPAHRLQPDCGGSWELFKPLEASPQASLPFH